MRTQHSEPRSTNTHGPSSSFRSARSTPVGRRSPILLLHLHLLPSRHDPPRRPRLGTVGQVGRSRNAQTADRRALRLRNPLGGRKSPLSPSLPSLPSVVPTFPPPHHGARDLQLDGPCLQTNPPTLRRGRRRRWRKKRRG